MSLQDILYITLAVCAVALTGTLIAAAIEAIEFFRASRRAADNAHRITEELQAAISHLSKSAESVATTVDEVITKTRDLKERIEDKAEDVAHSVGMMLGVYKLGRGAKSNGKSQKA